MYLHFAPFINFDIDDLVQECSISFGNALELLHSCTKSSVMCKLWNFSTKILLGFIYIMIVMIKLLEIGHVILVVIILVQFIW